MTNMHHIRLCTFITARAAALLPGCLATGRRTGVARACRLCIFRDAGAVGDERHLVLECAGLAPIRAKYADLSIACHCHKDHTTRPFFAQQDHLRVFHYVID